MPRSKFPHPISGKTLTGVLQQPIDKIPAMAIELLVHGEPEATRQAVYRVADEYEALQLTERLSALAEHYRVSLSSEAWSTELLLAVCRDFIVGFNNATEIGSAPTRKGNKMGNTEFPQFEFWRQVTLLQTAKGMELSDACRSLSRQRGKAWSGHSIRALRERFDRFSKRLQSFRDDAVFRQMIDVAKVGNANTLPE
jgi:hypothetical protein